MILKIALIAALNNQHPPKSIPLRKYKVIVLRALVWTKHNGMYIKKNHNKPITVRKINCNSICNLQQKSIDVLTQESYSLKHSKKHTMTYPLSLDLSTQSKINL